MKCFAITLPDNRNAKLQFQRLKESADRFNWNVELYQAVIGTELTPKHFKRVGIQILEDTTIEKRPGAQGCFMSHFNLWKKCIALDEPIIILESDAVIISELPELDLSEKLLRLHAERGNKKSKATGIWGLGAFGYALSPTHAKQLIDGAKTIGVKPVDKLIGNKIVDWGYVDVPLLKHEKLGRSTTSFSL